MITVNGVTLNRVQLVLLALAGACLIRAAYHYGRADAFGDVADWTGATSTRDPWPDPAPLRPVIVVVRREGESE